MLGNKIGQFEGQVTGTRILPGDDYRYVKMEVSFQQSGQILGVDATDIGTFVVYERAGGQMYATGNGIMGSPVGESAIWNGHGVGRPTGNGMAMLFRFSIALQAGPGKLAPLNDCLVLGEYESDADGKQRVTLWEWK